MFISIHHSLCQTLSLLLHIHVLLPKPRYLLVPLHVVHCQVTHLLLQLLDLRQGDVNVFTCSMFRRNDTTMLQSKLTLKRLLSAGKVPEPGHVVVEDGRLPVRAGVVEAVYEHAGQTRLAQVEVLSQDAVELISPEVRGESGVRFLSVTLVTEILKCESFWQKQKRNR